VKRGRHFSDLTESVKRLFERFLQTVLTHLKHPNRSTPWHGALYRAFLNTCKRLFEKNEALRVVCLLIIRFAYFRYSSSTNKLLFMVAVYCLTAKIRLLYLVKAFR